MQTKAEGDCHHFTRGNDVIDAGPPGADAVAVATLRHLGGHGAAHGAVVHRSVHRVPQLREGFPDIQ